MFLKKNFYFISTNTDRCESFTLIQYDIIYIIFILFYPFECQLLFLLLMYKLCPFFFFTLSYLFLLASFHVTLLKCTLLNFPIEFFLGRPFFLFPVILVCHTVTIHPHQKTKPFELLFMYFLQFRFNFQFLSRHFVSYSVAFILRK